MKQAIAIAALSLVLIAGQSSAGELWTMTYQDEYNYWSCTAHSLPENEIILTGYSYSFIRNFVEIFLIKAEADGELLWTRTINDNGREFNMIGRKSNLNDDIIFSSTDEEGNSDYWFQETNFPQAEEKSDEVQLKIKDSSGAAFNSGVGISILKSGDIFANLINLAGRMLIFLNSD